MVVVSVVTEKKHFKIVEREALSQETINKIIKEYIETDKSKVDAAVIASNKYDVSRNDCDRILFSIPHKPRYRYKNSIIRRIETQGGVDLIKAFKMERWTLGEMSTYLNVAPSSLHKYIEKHNIVLKKLPFREKVTDEDANWVKKKYGIK